MRIAPLVVQAPVEREYALVVSDPTAESNLSEGPGDGTVRSGWVARDPKMIALHRLIRRVAPSDLAILMMGETGTGKAMLAQLTHTLSTRAKAAFVRIDCAALARSSAESAVVGQDDRWSIEADRQTTGLFDAADGGTLFFDEVGELSLAIQAKLLRVLDRGELLPLEAVGPRKVSIRVIAATSSNLRPVVDAGHFRADLFYRLSGLLLRVPPLRERRADIPALIEFFAAQSATRDHIPPPTLTPATMAALCSYPWPGNIRELRRLMERNGASERDRIALVLAAVHGNQGRAAQLLGISRRTLARRLVACALSRPRETYLHR